MRIANKLTLQQIENRLSPNIAKTALVVPKDGWIRYMRIALGMTLRKLGEACGVSTPTIAQIEAREVDGRITVETLRKIADAMNCDFTYAFVPKSNMGAYLEKKAYEKAKRILSTADLHMSLEDQQVQTSLDVRIDKLKKKLISEGKVW